MPLVVVPRASGTRHWQAAEKLHFAFALAWRFRLALLGGAALQRCDTSLVLTAASGAEVASLCRQTNFAC
jgi:hypothetical protein